MSDCVGICVSVDMLNASTVETIMFLLALPIPWIIGWWMISGWITDCILGPKIPTS